MARAQPQAQAAPALRPEPPPAGETVALASFEEVVALAEARREGLLASQLRQFVRLVRFEPGALEFQPAPGAPRELAGQLKARLDAWTGQRWNVSVSAGEADPSLAERDDAAARTLLDEVRRHPLVEAALKTFPQARIAAVRDLPGKGKSEP
jgi:DNA polymerase-3 subunit gamma/tau